MEQPNNSNENQNKNENVNENQNSKAESKVAPIVESKVAPTESKVTPPPPTAASKKGGKKKNAPLTQDSIEVVNGNNAPIDPEVMKRLKVAIGRGDKATDAKFILNQIGKKEIFNKDNLRVESTLYFKDCKDCEFIIDSKCCKVLIESCSNIKFLMNSVITTSISEIWKSSDLHLDIKVRIDTFQVDMSTKIILNYHRRDMINSVVWAGVHDLHITIPDGAGGKELFQTGFKEMQTEYQDIKEDYDQFTVRIIEGKLISEQIVRLENGFPTTEREAKAFDEREARNKKAADKHIRKLVKSVETKHGSNQKVGRNDLCSCGSGQKFKKCCAGKK